MRYGLGGGFFRCDDAGIGIDMGTIGKVTWCVASTVHKSGTKHERGIREHRIQITINGERENKMQTNVGLLEVDQYGGECS